MLKSHTFPPITGVELFLGLGRKSNKGETFPCSEFLADFRAFKLLAVMTQLGSLFVLFNFMGVELTTKGLSGTSLIVVSLS